MVMTVGHGGREREYEYRNECLSVVAVKCTEDHCQFDVSCTVIPVTWQPMPLKNLGPKAHTLRTHVGGVLCAASANCRRCRGSTVHAVTVWDGSQVMPRCAGESWINYAHEYCCLLFMKVCWWEKTNKPTALWMKLRGSDLCIRFGPKNYMGPIA